MLQTKKVYLHDESRNVKYLIYFVFNFKYFYFEKKNSRLKSHFYSIRFYTRNIYFSDLNRKAVDFVQLSIQLF